MKIALLNLPVDNNYGGHLQRYALMKVLQDMGHDVTHINLRVGYSLPWYKKPLSYTKRFVLRYLLGRNVKIFVERDLKRKDVEQCIATEPFYQRYIKHTKPITDIKKLKKLQGYDAYIVGSDQVWRKQMAKEYLYSMFLDFVRGLKVKKIAYGVSLGVSENELSDKEIRQLSILYNKFNAVSVREDSALELFKYYGWNRPQAIQVLDPTMLLQMDDYVHLIKSGNTRQSPGNLFCYILDKTEEIDDIIYAKAKELGLNPFFLCIKDKELVSVEQWLRSFWDSEYVITDSYHGVVFSIIFNKPYLLIRNEVRGNARFDSILKLNQQSLPVDKKNVDLNMLREISLSFLAKI